MSTKKYERREELLAKHIQESKREYLRCEMGNADQLLDIWNEKSYIRYGLFFHVMPVYTDIS